MKLLIANRGEIALRIIRACKKLGISTVAVYSEPDQNSLHVREADEAFLLGPAASKESYLNQKKILELAKKAKVKLIHPGYGFLSENAHFAKACEKNKFLFVGPGSQTISLLGDKFKAKQLAQKCGVPLLSATQKPVAKLSEFKKVIQKIKFPIMLKAVGGGGGKGIRIVRSKKEALSAFERASSEALTAFNQPDLYIEPFLTGARHIEIQVMADKHGSIIPLGERECSVQRRFQKIIEETPSPFMTEDLREQMEQSAVSIFKASKYVNAGTVEFLVDEEKNFYFLEVNTRLQVEHPVTEMVYGVDLVCEQIQIALGKKCSFTAKPIAHGHAIELRVSAENPENNFYPSSGIIDCLILPKKSKHLRLDSSLFLNQEISLHYDPLLAKLICWQANRKETLKQLEAALNSFFISGIETNLSFLGFILKQPSFKAGDIHIHICDKFIESYKSKNNDSPFAAALAALLANLTDPSISSINFKRKENKKSKWQLAQYELHRNYWN